MSVFAEVEPGLFAQTDYSTWLVSSHPASMRDGARMFGGEWHWRSWAALTHSIKTGEPAVNHVYGMSVWQYFDEVDPAAGQMFDAAMTNVAARVNGSIVSAYDFSSFRLVVDVGGGHGALLADVLAAHPALFGVLFDRPSVVAEAKGVLQARGVADRCQVVAGDFLTGPVPAGADAYLLKTVLHDWNDEDACAILRNCRQAISGRGRLLVIDGVLPPPPAKAPGLATGIDLEMLVSFGGSERTEQEFQELFSAADFTLTRVLPTSSQFSIIEADAAQ